MVVKGLIERDGAARPHVDETGAYRPHDFAERAIAGALFGKANVTRAIDTAWVAFF